MRFVSYLDKGKVMVAPEGLVSIEKAKSPPVSFHLLPPFQPEPYNESFKPNPDLQQHLFGKLLLFDEIPFSLEDIHTHFLNGCVTYEKGIIENNGRYSCRRCGNCEKHLFASFACFRCKEEQCVYCRKCIMMGRISQCTPLVRWIGPSYSGGQKKSLLNWNGELSSAQREASRQLADRIGKRGEFLIWAVCGAGKTEVLFEAVEKSLCMGQRVCIATPRTDVVLELLPRLKAVFPQTKVIGLYGGSEERKEFGQLVISTTHQLLRYEQAFDFVVVDEVDAFPFSFDKSLQFAVQKAKKEEATLAYLTATPSTQMKKRMQKGELAFIKIPRRYHGFPLPVPKMKWCGNWQRKLNHKKLPEPIESWVKQQLEKRRQGFLFVPTIPILQTITEHLQTFDPQIEGVHAEDPERKEKVERFRKGVIPIIVTTTILERGVTVPFTDIAVLGAEDDVFTESALVQISGRAGRSKDDPNGEVIFYHYGKTNAMIQAIRHIESMNKEGFL
ncbi:DEAD/DEAH box helicase [Fictibacillus gelatini]|uniref:DEAD/DEAH box helicase n=1 Tax=Fictibacillus gelatini TaxID=225985 RepID=UPI0003F83E53|nr:DEAD/DEAH box helicase [Fictibacillus gelatini]